MTHGKFASASRKNHPLFIVRYHSHVEIIPPDALIFNPYRMAGNAPKPGSASNVSVFSNNGSP